MQLDINNSINFGSRNSIIRKADNIARYTNELYPRLSNTKVSSLSHYNYLYRLINYRKKINAVRDLSEKIYRCKKSNFYKCTSIIEGIKKYKVGNCGESAFLARIIAECNGINNTKIAYLDYNLKDLDHYVVYVDDEKPYIIDSWLGFADYVPKAIEKFCGGYRNFVIDDDVTHDNWLDFTKTTKNCVTHSKMRFSDKLISQLIEKYPELLLKKTK